MRVAFFLLISWGILEKSEFEKIFNLENEDFVNLEYDKSSRSLYIVGGFLMGGGIFNLVEGIINQHILLIHRVKTDGPNAIELPEGHKVPSIK